MARWKVTLEGGPSRGELAEHLCRAAANSFLWKTKETLNLPGHGCAWSILLFVPVRGAGSIHTHLLLITGSIMPVNVSVNESLTRLDVANARIEVVVQQPGNYRALLLEPMASLVRSLEGDPNSESAAVLGYN
jgi:hypothetical protein